VKIAHCAYSPEFYKLEETPSSLITNLYSIKAKYRFVENDHWFIHRTYVVPIIQLAMLKGVKVKYSAIDDTLLDTLNELKPQWEDAYKQIHKEVKNLSSEAEKAKWFAILYLTPDAPEFIVKAVWRALASKLHPDAGGDAEVFMELKNAYEEVLKHVR